MRSAVVIIAVVASICSCRRDAGEEDLKWSCATVHRSGPAIATPECYEDLQQTQSPVLKYYRAVPQTVDGKVEHYLLVEKDVRVETPSVAVKGPVSPPAQLKLESSAAGSRTEQLREKAN